MKFPLGLILHLPLREQVIREARTCPYCKSETEFALNFVTDERLSVYSYKNSTFILKSIDRKMNSIFLFPVELFVKMELMENIFSMKNLCNL